jgi:hypothetical protein
MKHLRVFFFQHRLPRVVGNRGKFSTYGGMPGFEIVARENRICPRDWTPLKIGTRFKRLRRQNFVGLGLLVWIVFPFNVTKE